MARYKLTLEYDGAGYVGWQRQENGRAVQQVVEEAVAAFCGAQVTVHGAGRTDSGVHALGQVAHIDLPKDYRAATVRDALNAHLAREAIAVLETVRVGEDFDARFCATRRHYLYRIATRRAPPALARGRVWHVRGELDARAMHEAAQSLLGRHDFTTFRAAQCQAKSALKTLDFLAVSQQAQELEIRASARSFLHHQVRSIVGSLKLVGEGKWSAADLKAALDAADRSRCGPVAPPGGLYLTKVDYGDEKTGNGA